MRCPLRALIHNARNGRIIIAHFGGPTWQATDGSEAVGRAEANVTVDATAIPWLRLAAVSTAAGAAGSQLVPTTYIQRINTVGGRPPAAGECDEDAVAEQREVPYGADYIFFKQSGS